MADAYKESKSKNKEFKVTEDDEKKKLEPEPTEKLNQ